MKNGKKGRLEDNVYISHGSSWITSDGVNFSLTGKGENIKTMLFRGNVKASLEENEEGPSTASNKEAIRLYSDKREIQA